MDPGHAGSGEISDRLQATPQPVPPHPGASTAAISLRMSRARRRDTAPEIALRKLLHARGLRYRVAYPVPGQRRRTIDIAFTRQKLAVFVDGCFWHGCPEHGTSPRANSEWWRRKLEANHARDLDTDAMLRDRGWTVLRIWEHEEADRAAAKVRTVLAGSQDSALAAPVSPPSTGQTPIPDNSTSRASTAVRDSTSRTRPVGFTGADDTAS